MPEDTIRSSLVFGRSAHAAFQHHFEQLLITDTVPSHDTLLEVFWDAWHDHNHLEIQFNKRESVSTVAALADTVLQAFEGSPMARPRGQIIAVEEELRGKIIAGAPEMLARLDLLVETDDAIHLTDLKTARTSWSEEQATRSGLQLLLYAELVKRLAGEKPIRPGYAVLTKGKAPDMTIHPVSAEPKDVARAKRVVEQVWRAIESGLVYPAPSPTQCPSCPYRQPCRDWTG